MNRCDHVLLRLALLRFGLLSAIAGIYVLHVLTNLPLSAALGSSTGGADGHRGVASGGGRLARVPDFAPPGAASPQAGSRCLALLLRPLIPGERRPGIAVHAGRLALSFALVKG